MVPEYKNEGKQLFYSNYINNQIFNLHFHIPQFLNLKNIYFQFLLRTYLINSLYKQIRLIQKLESDNDMVELLMIFEKILLIKA